MSHRSGSLACVIKRVSFWTDLDSLIGNDFIYPDDVLFVLHMVVNNFNFCKVFCPRLGTSGWVFGESVRLIHEAD